MPRPVIVCAVLLLLLAACAPSSVPAATSAVSSASPYVNSAACAANAVEITLIFALNPQQNYMTPAIDAFNSAYAQGTHPLTGSPLGPGERPVCVLGQLGGSSSTAQAIANTVIAPDAAQVARPTLFAPSVSTWLALANYRAGRDLFNMAEVQPIAYTPVVMAIWESRLTAIRDAIGSGRVGWADLMDVLASPNGWRDYGIADGRRAVFYGHTDPRSSSTGLSALIMAYYAAARADGFSGRRLETAQVNDPEVQAGVRAIEQLIRHYSTRTDDYLDYIALGSDYVDLVALEEVDLLYLNGAFSSAGFAPTFTPPERLVALYPEEGTLWHERPIGIPDGDWVTAEQRDAAQTFIRYLQSPDVQRAIMQRGFRPVIDTVPLAAPFVPEYGVDPNEPSTLLAMPSAETIVAIQQSWGLVKKRADVMLLIDISGSMNDENRIVEARDAAQRFIDTMDPGNRVGLATFSSQIRVRVPIQLLETNAETLRLQIRNLNAEGGTELYAAVSEIVTGMNQRTDTDRMRAVIVLSDGQDTGERGVTLADAVRAITDSQDSVNPVIVIPLAYGSDADLTALTDLARASRTRVQSGSPENIGEVLEILQSFF